MCCDGDHIVCVSLFLFYLTCDLKLIWLHNVREKSQYNIFIKREVYLFIFCCKGFFFFTMHFLSFHCIPDVFYYYFIRVSFEICQSSALISFHNFTFMHF